MSVVRRAHVFLEEGGGIAVPASDSFIHDGGGGSVAMIDDGGGPVISNVDVHPIFWGKSWREPQSPSTSAIEEAFAAIVSGPYMSGLAQYRNIRRGRVSAGVVLPVDPQPQDGFLDTDVSTMLIEALDAGTIPKPTTEDVIFYVVVLPSGLTSADHPGGLGEHRTFLYNGGSIYWAWVRNDGTLDFVTEVFSHELAEACTDPDGTAFQIVPRSTNAWNEIGDEGCGCQSVDERIDGVLVQKYWSQRDKQCIAPSSDIVGVVDKVVLGETTDAGPALASFRGRLFLAWTGSGNPQLNLMVSNDDGRTFGDKHVSDEASDDGPALAVHNDQLFIAWRGSDNNVLNVAKVSVSASGSIDGIVEKVILDQSSDVAPAIASKSGRLFIAWKGESNDLLNLMLSEDNGASFRALFVSDQTTQTAPALNALNSRLFLGWRGEGDEHLNVAKVSLTGSTAGHLGIEGLEDQDVLDDTSGTGPSLALTNGRLYLSWKGSGNDNINISYSDSFGLNFVEKHVSPETTHAVPALASHNGLLLLAWQGRGDGDVNVARVDRYSE
jgi:hypothetical protein